MADVTEPDVKNKEGRTAVLPNRCLKHTYVIYKVLCFALAETTGI